MTDRDTALRIQSHLNLMHKELAARISSDPTILSTDERKGLFLATLMASACELAAYDKHIALATLAGITASLEGELTPEGHEALTEFRTTLATL